MTPEQRGDLAERMVYKGARLVAVVHGDGGEQDVDNLIGHLGIVQLRALAIVLAAMVDPETVASDALAWVSWDEQLRPVRNARRPETLSQLAERRILANGEAA